ncbi:MAG TPA: energy-coupling factor transporter transmembrane component T [Mycobacteriales bacterium]|jgi:energy-coupling factor transport system permease protein|nr:energy-coupling factor transporter transmembrane component T [Mycobacteriales bacterium]
MPAPTATRQLHAGAWWLWALGLGTAASRTTNPLLLAILGVVAGYVVAVRRSAAPWTRTYGMFVKIGLVVLGLRLIVSVGIAPAIPGRVLFTLPAAQLPGWAAGVRLGGAVTLEGLLAAGYDGLQLAVLLGCIGAANALAHPARLLGSLPGALYEMGIVLVVALSFAPGAIAAISRIRTARRLRGRPVRGIAGLLGLIIPVLESAVTRSIELAASMDSRGYGRRAGVSPAARRLTAWLLAAAMCGVCVGLYGLLDASTPRWLGGPALALGAVLAVAGLTVGGRRTTRSRYRPDRWLSTEWLVAGCGIAVAVAFLAFGSAAALRPPASPVQVPQLPIGPLVGALLGLLPAWLAPAPAVRAPVPA